MIKSININGSTNLIIKSGNNVILDVVVKDINGCIDIGELDKISSNIMTTYDEIMNRTVVKIMIEVSDDAEV